MSKVSIPFSATSLDAWRAQLLKELKENTALLQYNSSIEEISFSLLENEGPQLKFKESSADSWKRIVAADASKAKKSNEFLLSALMQGADAILIEHTTTDTDWSALLNEVETAYISCLLLFETPAAHAHFIETAPKDQIEHCIALHNYGAQQNFISTYAVQQIGANCSTEIAAGLIHLHQQLELNNKDTTLYFEMGVGKDYLVEIAKFRALKMLLAQLEEIHEVHIDLQLIARTGFCNKSLVDPYTNLLRLSTEGLSAVMGGAAYVCLQPYDALSKEGASAFAQRMSLNIGNLLSEEAQLTTLNDPLSGAYAIEQLSLALAKKSWTFLCELDTDPAKVEQKLKTEIAQTRALRTADFQSGKDILIGINAFPNEFESPKAEWSELPTALDLPYLIFEKPAN
jgi:methylmalonyl-CoA mutase